MENIRNVMLVDDNVTDNYIGKRIMEILNFADVIEVKNSGIEALEFLEANNDNSKILPELIFLDINMPLMDGFQFIDEFKKLSELKGSCKIVVLTSHYNLYYMSKIIDNPHIISYVTKPLTEEVLNDIKFKYASLLQSQANP